MRTIIPFSLFPALGGEAAPRRDRPTETIIPLAISATASDETVPDLPEGETMSADIALLPRARAVHADIVGLIRAVRGRFG